MGHVSKQTLALSRIRTALSALDVSDGDEAFLELASDFLEDYTKGLLPLEAHHHALDHDENAALMAAGIAAPDQQALARTAIKTASHSAALVLTGLSCAEAAERLGVTDSRIRQRIAERSLLAFRTARSRAFRLPSFQFVADGELPCLSDILKSVRKSVPVSVVVGFFLTPQPDLEDQDGAAMTPVAWLTTGGDAELVAQLASDL